MLLSRRSVFTLVVLAVFATALWVASRRLSDQCPGGPYCPDFSRISSNVSPPGDVSKTGKETKEKETAEQPAEDTSSTEHPDTTESNDGGSTITIVPENEETKNDDTINTDHVPIKAAQSPCANFPDTSDVLLIMKTGASEAYSKVPTQIMTNLQCLPEYYIFSDMEQHIAGHKIYDSLDDVLQDVKTNNKDFDLYLRQKACTLDLQLCQVGYDLGAEGWALDKYKFVHVAEKTYKMRPDYKWYLFVEADTYVVWSNIMEWLKRLDHTKPLYLGSVAMLNNEPFGHGGSGYIMSHAAMHDMFEGKTRVANTYDKNATQTCCGDALFAAAVKNETGVKIQHTVSIFHGSRRQDRTTNEQQYPAINGDKPHTIPYSEDLWCHPIATMHHVSPQDVNDLATFERERGFSGPLRIKDIYKRFIQPHMVPHRDDWDNLSDDELYLNSSSRKYDKGELDRAKTKDLTPLEESAHESFEACQKACESLDRCFQYRFHNGICFIGKKIRHGEPKKPTKIVDKQYKSGWNMDKITQWVEAHEHCDGVKWPEVK